MVNIRRVKACLHLERSFLAMLPRAVSEGASSAAPLHKADLLYLKGQAAEDPFEKAQAFNQALALYSAAEKEGSHHKLLKAIGNCYAQLGEAGWASFYFQRAAKSSADQKWFAGTCLLIGFLFCLASLWLWFGAATWRHPTLVAAAAFVVVLGIVSFRDFYAPAKGVVVSQAALHQQMDSSVKALGEVLVPAGVKVQVVEASQDAWLRIRTPGGDTGYVQNRCVRII